MFLSGKKIKGERYMSAEGSSVKGSSLQSSTSFPKVKGGGPLFSGLGPLITGGVGKQYYTRISNVAQSVVYWFLFTVLFTVPSVTEYTSVADPGFPWGGGANSPGEHQHTILPKFPKNCMKLKEFGPGGHASLMPPLDLPLYFDPPKILSPALISLKKWAPSHKRHLIFYLDINSTTKFLCFWI